MKTPALDSTVVAISILLLSVALGQVVVPESLLPESPEPSFSQFYRCGTSDTYVFRARDNDHGSELWILDSTGPHLLLDIAPGRESSYPDNFVSLPNGRVLFHAWTKSGGIEPWATNCTETGTILLVDHSGDERSSNPSRFSVLQNDGIFSVLHPDTNLYSVYFSDGTKSGTVPGPAPSNGDPITNNPIALAVGCGSYLYLSWISGASSNPPQLWVMTKNDWTLPDYYGFSPRNLFCGPNGRLYYEAKLTSNWNQLYLDGTTMGEVSINPAIDQAAQAVFNQSTYFFGDRVCRHRTTGENDCLTVVSTGTYRQPSVFNDNIYFYSKVGTTYILRRYDGANSYTVGSPLTFASDAIPPMKILPLSTPLSNGVLALFVGSSNASLILYGIKADDTVVNYGQITEDIECTSSTTPQTLPLETRAEMADGVVVFSIASDRGYHFRKLSGSTNSFYFDIHAGPDYRISPIGPGNEIAGGILFSAWSSQTGHEVWWSDGSAASTVLVKDILPGCRSSFADLRNAVKLSATGAIGFIALQTQLWTSAGTSQSTSLVGGEDFGMERLYQQESACSGLLLAKAGDKLYKSDLTMAGTSAIYTFAEASSEVIRIFCLHDNLFFIAASTPDPTPIGLSFPLYLLATSGGATVVDPFAGSPSFSADNIVYPVSTGLLLTLSNELRVTNGSAAVTLRSTVYDYFAFAQVTESQGAMIFAIGSQGHKLCLVSQNLSLSQLISVNAVGNDFFGSSASQVIKSRARAFASGLTSTFERTLYVTDLTPAGTSIIFPASDGIGYLEDLAPTSFGGVVFQRNIGPGQYAIWISNGTKASSFEILSPTENRLPQAEYGLSHFLTVASSRTLLLNSEAGIWSIPQPCLEDSDCGERTDRFCAVQCANHLCQTLVTCTGTDTCDVANGICITPPLAPQAPPFASPVSSPATSEVPSSAPSAVNPPSDGTSPPTSTTVPVSAPSSVPPDSGTNEPTEPTSAPAANGTPRPLLPSVVFLLAMLAFGL